MWSRTWRENSFRDPCRSMTSKPLTIVHFCKNSSHDLFLTFLLQLIFQQTSHMLYSWKLTQFFFGGASKQSLRCRSTWNFQRTFSWNNNTSFMQGFNAPVLCQSHPTSYHRSADFLIYLGLLDVHATHFYVSLQSRRHVLHLRQCRISSLEDFCNIDFEKID